MPRSKIQPDDATLNAEAIRRAELVLFGCERSPAAMVADLCALFSELAHIKRERDEREAWWRAVLDKPESLGRPARHGFAHKDGDYEGPMAHKLGEETLDVVRTVCSRCGRTGKYLLSELLHRYGPQQSMPGLLQALAADCPRQLLGHVPVTICRPDRRSRHLRRHRNHDPMCEHRILARL